MDDAALTSYITYSTWQKYIVMSNAVRALQVREKRGIFQTLRHENNHDIFFPGHGITAGTFCIWQILLDNKRPRKKQA